MRERWASDIPAATACSWLRFRVAGAASANGGEGGTHQSLPGAGIRLAMLRVRRQTWSLPVSRATLLWPTPGGALWPKRNR